VERFVFLYEDREVPGPPVRHAADVLSVQRGVPCVPMGVEVVGGGRSSLPGRVG
jgi:hypothetical protein